MYADELTSSHIPLFVAIVFEALEESALQTIENPGERGGNGFKGGGASGDGGERGRGGG